MILPKSAPGWFGESLTTADGLRNTIGVLLVANVKGLTTPIGDYETDSITTEFLSNKELDDFITGFEKARIYCEVVIDETGFLGWLNDGDFSFARPFPLVYNISQNGTGSARFSLVPGLCRLYRIALVDSDAYTVALGQHKFHFISLLERFGLPVSPAWWFTRDGWWPDRPPSGLRVIAKPTLESASVGIHPESIFVVDSETDDRLTVLLKRFRQPMTIQEFVAGFEVEVPMLEGDGPKACMAVGIELRGQRDLGESILSYDDVFADTYSFYNFADENPQTADYIQEIARLAYLGLGFVGPARIDFRVTADGKPKIMEVSCKPHLTVHSSFTFALRAMAHPYSDLLKSVVGSAARRLGVESI